MTIRDYIVQKFQSFGIELSEADFSDFQDKYGISPDSDKSSENTRIIKLFMIDIMDQYKGNTLKSISESGFSVSWGDDRLGSFYNSLCEELEIPNKYITTIEDATNKW